MEQLNIKLEAFEGPLDLLYHLVEKNEIDIYDIPIAELTTQYMEYLTLLQSRTMESMSEFMLMAATLLEIKSKMLLPRPKKDEDEVIDPRQELVNRLIEYKRFKLVAEEFKELGDFSVRYFYKPPELQLLNELQRQQTSLTEKTVSEVLDGISMENLYEVFEQALMRRELKTDRIRSGFNSVKRDLFSVDDKIRCIRELLAMKKRVTFYELLDVGATRQEMVVTFLAVLEMMKRVEIVISQNRLFDEISITYSHI